MFLYSSFHHDTRVYREVTALVTSGYRVEVVAALDPLRPGALPAREEHDGYSVTRVDRDGIPARLARAAATAIPQLRPAPKRTDGGLSPSTGGPDASSKKPASGAHAGAYRLATRLVKVFDYWRYLRNAVAAVRPGGSAIFVAHDLITLPVAWYARRRLGGGLVYDSHELYAEHDAGELTSRLARWRWRAVESRLIRRADHVITVSDSIAHELRDRYGVAQPTVIRNVPQPPDDSARALDLRAELALGDEERIVLYVGGLTRNRGLEQLVEASAELTRCVVVLLGSGEPTYVEFLRKLVADRAVEGRVRILPAVTPESVIPTARRADIGVTLIQNVALNNYYSLPNKLFEYIHAGLPVVASFFPELERVVNGRGIGVTCDPSHASSVAGAVQGLLEDDAGRAEMERNALAASRELNWQQERKKLLPIYDGLAADLERSAAAEAG